MSQLSREVSLSKYGTAYPIKEIHWARDKENTMQKVQLVPMTDEQKDALGVAKPRVSKSLKEEVEMMKNTLRLAYETLDNEPDTRKDNLARYGSMIARLADSIVRATMAEIKLARSNDEMVEVRAEIKRIFRAIGWGEET